MDPATIAAGVGLVGNILGGATASHEATKNRRWQEKMRSTQYQTAMEDMRKAGLNPMLAYSQGGAGVPSGAQSAGYQIDNPALTYYTAKNAAQQFKNAKQQQSLIAAQDVAARANALNSANAASNQAAMARLNNAEAEKAELTRLPYELLNGWMRNPSTAVDAVRQFFGSMFQNSASKIPLPKGQIPVDQIGRENIIRN